MGTLKTAWGVITAVALASSFVAGGAAVLGNVDALAGDIRGVLAYKAPAEVVPIEQDGTLSGSLDIVEDHTVPEAVRFVQFTMLLVLLGGVPAAILAKVLARRSEKRQVRWAAQWSQVFLAGFVLQLSNLLIAAFFLIGFSIEGGVESLLHWEPLLASFLILNIASSSAALPAWRVLQWHASAGIATLDYRNPLTS